MSDIFNKKQVLIFIAVLIGHAVLILIFTRFFIPLEQGSNTNRVLNISFITTNSSHNTTIQNSKSETADNVEQINNKVNNQNNNLKQGLPKPKPDLKRNPLEKKQPAVAVHQTKNKRINATSNKTQVSKPGDNDIDLDTYLKTSQIIESTKQTKVASDSLGKSIPDSKNTYSPPDDKLENLNASETVPQLNTKNERKRNTEETSKSSFSNQQLDSVNELQVQKNGKSAFENHLNKNYIAGSNSRYGFDKNTKRKGDALNFTQTNREQNLNQIQNSKKQTRIIQAQFVNQVMPTYPEDELLDNRDGEAVYEFNIDRFGKVEVSSLKLVSATSPSFAKAARVALLASEFKPAYLNHNGKQVAQRVRHRTPFVLKGF